MLEGKGQSGYQPSARKFLYVQNKVFVDDEANHAPCHSIPYVPAFTGPLGGVRASHFLNVFEGQF